MAGHIDEYIKGVDISTLLEEEKCGAVYYDEKGNKRELIGLLKEYNINYVRLRLWNDPYGPGGEPYGAGNCDINCVKELARRVKEAGLKVLLDIHYSDFWADPGKQRKPKAWVGLSVDELEKAVYDFTLDTMKTLEDANVYPDMVQVGNELSSGLLWPEGQWPQFDNMARFVSAGIRAVREADRLFSHDIPVMIHLDNGGKNELYREWFDNYIKRGEDFDIIGLSYYPFWHGSLAALKANMQDVAERYGKELVVAEVSMGFSMEDYGRYEGLAPEDRKGYATRQELVDKLEHAMTPEGQKAFMQDFLAVLESVKDNKARGFFWWEAGWIPVPGSGWATESSLEYIKEKGPCGNEWANQALFDYEGHVLPTLDLIKEYKVK